MRLLEPEMDADNIQVYFTNVLWVAFSIPQDSLSLLKYAACTSFLNNVLFNIINKFPVGWFHKTVIMKLLSLG
jgi:hypothetical protein